FAAPAAAGAADVVDDLGAVAVGFAVVDVAHPADGARQGGVRRGTGGSRGGLTPRRGPWDGDGLIPPPGEARAVAQPEDEGDVYRGPDGDDGGAPDGDVPPDDSAHAARSRRCASSIWPMCSV